MSDTAVGPLPRGMDVVIGLGRGDGPPAVTVHGRVDVHSASSLRDTLQCLLRSASEDLVVDASALLVADEAGRAALEGVARHCREFGGQVLLPAPVPAPEG
ncbi:STAS domain-containing protein [Cellulomonas endophytica]|uniref:STAS domain-containing protein n=1 Tax=Cellulomonas endophytica TaxID=2494735 RepID=UPI0010108561|nr:STAS domain-containing protein [Cellulomonas endophytica]